MVKGLWSIIKPRYGEPIPFSALASVTSPPLGRQPQSKEKGQKASPCGTLVSLTALGNQHFEETGEDLQIVTDYSIISWLYQSKTEIAPNLDWRVNGDYQLLRNALKKFLTLMHKNHISLIFFFTALNTINNESSWISELKKKKTYHESFMKMMKGKKNLMEENSDILVAQSFTIAELGHVVQEEKCPFFIVSDKAYMYSYARKINAYGALLNETDALVHNLNFLSTDSLSVENNQIHCFQYVPEDVCKYLNIQRKHFALLASFAGNDMTADAPDMGTLRNQAMRRKFGKDSEKKVSPLVVFAESLSQFDENETILSILEKLEVPKTLWTLFVESCAYYSFGEHPTEGTKAIVSDLKQIMPPHLPELLFSSFYDLKNLFNIIKFHEFVLPVNREYFGKDFLIDLGHVVIGNSDPVNLITQPLRKSIYSFLCPSDDKENPTTVTEGGPIGEKFVNNESIVVEPLADDVWQSFRSKKYQIRKALYLSILGYKDDPDFIDDTWELIVLGSLVYILRYRRAFLFEWEFDALLSYCFTVRELREGESPPQTKNITPRGMYVFSVFEQCVSMCIHLCSVLRVQNDENTLPPPHKLISASLFHLHYNSAHDALKSAQLKKAGIEMKKTLIGDTAPEWLSIEERKLPYTAYVRSIDTDQPQSAFKQLFSHLGSSMADVRKAPEGSECCFAFIEFSTLDGLRGAIAMNGTRFGRFCLDISPAEQRKTSHTFTPHFRQDRDGFEQVKTSRQKKQFQPQQPQVTQQQKVEKSVLAQTKQHKRKEEVEQSKRKVLTNNAFAALDEDDE